MKSKLRVFLLAFAIATAPALCHEKPVQDCKVTFAVVYLDRLNNTNNGSNEGLLSSVPKLESLSDHRIRHSGNHQGSKQVPHSANVLCRRNNSSHNANVRHASKPTSSEASGKTRQLLSLKDLMRRCGKDFWIERNYRVGIVINLQSIRPLLSITFAVH
jgi:hypothetical protein